jgi:hypothetical protein
MIDLAAEAKEARAILREHEKKAGHVDASRCPTCIQFRDLAERLEAAAKTAFFVPDSIDQKQA